jgi:hypothetical protein
MAYFRVKRTRLGAAYEQFLADVLEPGGTIVLAECGQRWPVTTIGERHLFQFGAVGGMSPDEYRDGSMPCRHLCPWTRSPIPQGPGGTLSQNRSQRCLTRR